ETLQRRPDPCRGRLQRGRGRGRPPRRRAALQRDTLLRAAGRAAGRTLSGCTGDHHALTNANVRLHPLQIHSGLAPTRPLAALKLPNQYRSAGWPTMGYTIQSTMDVAVFFPPPPRWLAR